MSTRLADTADQIARELERAAVDTRAASDVAARVRAIAAAASLEVDLLLEPEPDAFIHDVEAGLTAIVGMRASGRAPWETADILRWSESDFVRTNGTTLSVADVIALQELGGAQPGIFVKLVDSCLLRAELMRDAIAIEDDEVQAGVDEFRQQRQLLTARATEAWLEAQGMDLEGLEALVTERLRVATLQQRIVGARVTDELERNLEAWDVVTVTELRLAAGESVPDESGFVTAVARQRGTLFDRRFRRALPPALASRVAPGLIGPLDDAHGRSLYRVWHVEAARRDEPTRVAVTKQLFDEWLATRRRSATIAWNEPPRS